MNMLENLFFVVFVVFTAATPLDDYVNAPDPFFSYTSIGGFSGDGWQAYVLNITSQQWLSLDQIDSPIWQHRMVVVVPDNLLEGSQVGLMYMTGGNTNDPPPTAGSSDVGVVIDSAMRTGLVSSVLYQIPNQPIIFRDDSELKPRYEDDYIAYTWKHYIEEPSANPNPYWLARMPMTKAGAKGLDALQLFSTNTLGIPLTGFVVSGGSKRGWTAWTLAAVDSRVVAAVPVVMSELNFNENIHHHFQMLGGWTYAFYDYWALNMTLYTDHPRMMDILDIVDPFSYKERYTMPVNLLSASGDQFFMPDDTRYWIDQMPTTIYYRMLPNCEHSMATCPQWIESAAAFINTVTRPDESSRPIFTWDISASGTVTVFPETVPLAVRLWTAKTAPDSIRKDFRLTKLDELGNVVRQDVPWRAAFMEPNEKGIYEGSVQVPKSGYIAIYVELDYPGVPGFDIQQYTTDVSIIPDNFPFPDCSGDGCFGTLV